MTTMIRSRKVRRILRLEGQADRQATREARATARALTLRRRVDTLRTEVRALEASLSGGQRGELARVRAEGGVPAVAATPVRGRRRAVDPPNDEATDPRPLTCPLAHEEV